MSAPGRSDRHALIVGVGPGLGASLARRFAAQGFRVSVAARSDLFLRRLQAEIGAIGYRCDASDPDSVARLFADAEKRAGPVNVCVYNAGSRVRGPICELDEESVARCIAVTGTGGFFVGRMAAKSMLASGGGAIFFTGASASVKGYAHSAAFAMGKFALRGLAQSMARELAPRNIHVAHFVIDGGIRSEGRPADPSNPDALLAPESIADSYWNVYRQDRSAWSWEIELRPWVEPF